MIDLNTNPRIRELEAQVVGLEIVSDLHAARIIALERGITKLDALEERLARVSYLLDHFVQIDEDHGAQERNLFLTISDLLGKDNS